MTTVDVLLAMVDEAFDRKSWHGTNLRGSIRGLSAADAAWRPGPGRHSVWEIALHAAYWKYTVRRRLAGEKPGAFPLVGSNWFARPSEGADPYREWKSDVALLVDTHKQLREQIVRLKPADLDRKIDSGAVNIGQLVRGIAAHDLYHAGQIQMLKRLRVGER
jgi:uncharacterized damage-inducible protein DinB